MAGLLSGYRPRPKPQPFSALTGQGGPTQEELREEFRRQNPKKFADYVRRGFDPLGDTSAVEAARQAAAYLSPADMNAMFAPRDDVGFDMLPAAAYPHRGGQAQAQAQPLQMPRQPTQELHRDLERTGIADWTPEELQAYGRGEGRMAQRYDPRTAPFGISGERMLLEQKNREREGQFFNQLSGVTDHAIRRSTDVDPEYERLQQRDDRQDLFPNLRYGDTEHKALKAMLENEVNALLEVEERARRESARRKGQPLGGLLSARR